MQRDLRLCDGVSDLPSGKVKPMALGAALVAAGCVGLAFTGAVWGLLPADDRAAPAREDETVTRADTGAVRLDLPQAADEDALGFGLADMLARRQAVNPDGAAQLETMITTALQEGRSTAYIDTLVNRAAERGTVTAPPEFVTVEGRVDTATLIGVLGGRGPAPSGPGSEAGYYIVRPGDSLASIAFRHYGQAGLHQEIFRANSDRLQTPADLRAGLRLVMPAL